MGRAGPSGRLCIFRNRICPSRQNKFWICLMFELLYPATSILSTVLLSWSGFRAWHAQNRFLKWGGAGLSALLSAITALISVVLIVGLIKVHARSAPTVIMEVEGKPEQIRRGKAISD